MNDPTFIITTILGVLTVLIPIWLAFRQPIRLPIGYETLAVQPLEDSEDDVKKILIQNFPDETINKWHFVTFRVWNSGHDSIELPDDTKPLIIAFKKGITIFECKRVETTHDKIEFTAKPEAEKVLLTFPLLDPKESITLRILVSEYVNYFPEVYARVPGRKRIVRANNIRHTKEFTILGLICLFLLAYFIYSFSQKGLVSPSPSAIPGLWLSGIFLFLACFDFFLLGWLHRRMPPVPNSILPSTFLYLWLQILLRGLPGLIMLGILAGIIYIIFGLKALLISFVIFFVGLMSPLYIWHELYSIAIEQLQKRQITYKAPLVIILTAIPSIAVLCFFIYFFLFSCYILLSRS